MGEEFEGTQVSCRVGAKIGTRPCSGGQISGFMGYSFVADLSFLLPTFEFSRLSTLLLPLYFGFLPSFRSLDNRLALFFIHFLPFVLLSSSTAFLTNLLTLYDNAPPSYSLT